MADKSRVVLHGNAFVALLQSPAMRADLKRRADRIAAAAGPGMVAEEVRLTSTRARVSVKTETFDAKRAEATDRALTRAIDAGR